MLVGSVNYNNGLGYFLTFLLAAVALVSILHTHRDLAGLGLSATPGSRVHAGGLARFEIFLDNRGGHRRHGVMLRHAPAGPSAAEVARAVQLPPDHLVRVEITVPAPHRGWLALPPVTISSRHPFGLFRAWHRGALPARTLVYPCPEGPRALPPRRRSERSTTPRHGPGGEDFSGLREYRPGDPTRMIHWKAVARGDQIPLKLYDDGGGETLWLRFEDTAGDLEARLSQLTAWVLEASAAGHRYGLVLPAERLAPDGDEAHREACLRRLALHGLEEPADG